MKGNTGYPWLIREWNDVGSLRLQACPRGCSPILSKGDACAVAYRCLAPPVGRGALASMSEDATAYASSACNRIFIR